MVIAGGPRPVGRHRGGVCVSSAASTRAAGAAGTGRRRVAPRMNRIMRSRPARLRRLVLVRRPRLLVVVVLMILGRTTATTASPAAVVVRRWMGVSRLLAARRRSAPVVTRMALTGVMRLRVRLMMGVLLVALAGSLVPFVRVLVGHVWCVMALVVRGLMTVVVVVLSVRRRPRHFLGRVMVGAGRVVPAGTGRSKEPRGVMVVNRLKSRRVRLAVMAVMLEAPGAGDASTEATHIEQERQN